MQVEQFKRTKVWIPKLKIPFLVLSVVIVLAFTDAKFFGGTSVVLFATLLGALLDGIIPAHIYRRRRISISLNPIFVAKDVFKELCTSVFWQAKLKLWSNKLKKASHLDVNDRIIYSPFFFLVICFLILQIYAALIGVAEHYQFTWVNQWFSFTEPMVEFVSKFTFVIEVYKEDLSQNGYEHRIGIVTHIYAVNFIVASLFVIFAVLPICLNKKIIIRNIRNICVPHFGSKLAGMPFFVGWNFGVSLAFLILGFVFFNGGGTGAGESYSVLVGEGSPLSVTHHISNLSLLSLSFYSTLLFQLVLVYFLKINFLLIYYLLFFKSEKIG
jgi:hypothetical protein